ncbi:MAG: ArdC-like ssDNA-binding domain-containing protein, partial [Thermoplasmata archaeon]
MHHQNNIDPRPGKVGQLRNLYETLKERLVNFKNSDDYIQFLKFQAHTLKTNIAKYSFANRLLIYAQKPTATYVAGYKTWKEFNRYVLHGEKAI